MPIIYPSGSSSGGVTSHDALSNLEYDVSGHDGFQRDTFTSVSNPTVDNDSANTAGNAKEFEIGNIWVNTSTSDRFVCMNASVGSAVWTALGAKPDLNGYLDGMSIERQELSIVIDSGHVYLDVEAIDGGDIDYWLDDIKYTLDCTTGSGVGGRARVELTQGTATVPIRSIQYVQYSEQLGQLELVSTLSHPTGVFAPVALAVIQDHTSVTANEPLVLQRTTETIAHNGSGRIHYIDEKLRALGAQYWDGVDPSISITTNAGSEDNVNFTTTFGEVFQLHRQSWPNRDVTASDGIFVANASGSGTLTNYQKLSDLNEIHEIANGTAIIDGDIIVLDIWGSINYSADMCKLFVNLPTAVYTSIPDARIDLRRTAKQAMPIDFQTTGFLIARLVLKWTTANNGTWENALQDSFIAWDTQTANVDSPNYPSDYPNNSTDTNTLAKAGADSVRVHFDDFITESNYDFVTIRNATDPFPTTVTERRTDPLSYHGNLGSFTSAAIPGTTIRVQFTSDGSVTRTGFHIDALEYSTIVASGAEVINLRGASKSFNL